MMIDYVVIKYDLLCFQVFWGFYLLIAMLNSLDLYYQVKKGYSNKRLREGYDSLE